MTRFAVGIDLGTTHCALAVAPLDSDAPQPQVLTIPQLVAQGQTEAPPLLPSFLYFAHESEGPQSLPWDAERSFVVGEYARARGVGRPRSRDRERQELALAPHGRPARRLPPPRRPRRRGEDLARRGVVALPRAPLGGVRRALRGRATRPSSKQDVVVTVPASFDASARELTVEAALAAGIENLTLLEEPQAALYAWIAGDGRRVAPADFAPGRRHPGRRRRRRDDRLLRDRRRREGRLARARPRGGRRPHPARRRQHGPRAGAPRAPEARASRARPLDRWQQASLVHACRVAKERLLSDASLERSADRRSRRAARRSSAATLRIRAHAATR